MDSSETISKEPQWTEKVRIYHMPDCKMVSSGDGLFGDDNFALFILIHENICVGLRPTISKNLSVFSCVSNQQPA
jgi:hypothetical protein